MAGCVFCKIAAGEIPATIVKRADGMMAFQDLNPQAPTHLLVIPTDHLASLNDARDPQLLGRLLGFARDLARDGCRDGAARLPRRREHQPRRRPDRVSPTSASAGRPADDVAARLAPGV